MGKQHDNSFRFTVQSYGFTSDKPRVIYTANYKPDGNYEVTWPNCGEEFAAHAREVVIELILNGKWNVLQEEPDEEAILTSEKESKIVKAATKLFKIMCKYDSADELSYEQMKELKRVRSAITRLLCDGGY